jgi:hypothetical protein
VAEGRITRREASDRQKDAKLRFIAYVRSGLDQKAAAREMGRSYATVRDWGRWDTYFKMQVDQAQAAAKREARTARDRAKANKPTRLGDEIKPVVRADYESIVDYWVAFRATYFGYETFDHQYEMLYAYERAPAGGITLILLPPEGMKSTTLLDTICADLCDDPNQHRALVSESGEVAAQMIGRVQRRMTVEAGVIPLMVQHFGPFEPLSSDRTRKWNTTEMRLATATDDSADPTLLGIGMGGSIRNRRWTGVDIDDPQSVRFLSKTPQYLQIIRQDILTRPGATGRTRITSSRVGREDLFDAMIREEMIDELVVIPALSSKGRSYFPLQYHDDGTPKVGPNGLQLGWSEDQLAQRRKKIGEDQWSRVYMQEPESQFTSALTAADIMAATDADRPVGAAKGSGVICSLDPALQGHAAYVVCSYDAEHLYVTDVIDQYRPAKFQKIFETIEVLTVRYKPTYWIIEENTMQSGFARDDFFLALRDRHGFFVSPHHTGAQKRDDMIGVPTLMGAISRGEVRFPRITDADAAFHEMYEQLIRWRPDIATRLLKQDLVMALWFAYVKWRALRETLEAAADGWHRPGLADPTLYPYAKANLTLPAQREREKTAVTYAQQWDALSQRS